jgi:hypothetical protein
LINQTLQQIDAARALLSRHLPEEIAEHLQFHTLTAVDASLIDTHLRRRFADRLFKIDVSPETVLRLGMKVNYIYIFVLIEHKSTDEPYTLIQMLGYLIRIWENAVADDQPVVPILPWVLYNGIGPWRASRSLGELIPAPAVWQRYMPAMELAILDISRMDDAKMAGPPILRAALTLLKYGRSSQLEFVLRRLFEFLADAIQPQQATAVLETLRLYVMSVNPVLGEEKMRDLVSEFWPVQPELGSVADQLIKKGEARGEALGVAREKRNTIRMLQAILGLPESPDDTLAGQDLPALQAMIDTLRAQLVNRPGR